MNKLLVGRTRFSKLALVLGLAMVAQAWAAPANIHKITDDDRQIADQAKSMSEAAGKSGMLDEDWMLKAMKNVDSARDQALDVYQEMAETNPTIQHAKSMRESKLADANYDTLIFVSYSLGDPALKEILALASGKPGTAIVMRGIPDGTTIGQGVLAMQKMAVAFDPVPNIVLDPTLFQKHHVTAVPTIVAMSERKPESNEEPDPGQPIGMPADTRPVSGVNVFSSDKREVARVQGLYDPTWLNEQVVAGAKGDLGLRGPVTEIAERDLIEVMKERVMAVDWNQRREQAKNRYWQGRTFIELPRAPKARMKLVDAEVVATADILTSDGQFVAHAGDKVNPLAARPFTQAIVVFDPTDPEQMDMLKEAMPKIEAEPNVARSLYIATRIDKEQGWDGYEALTKSLQAPVYLLTKDVQSRFELEYTPSIVTANDTHFIVRELAKRTEQEQP